jgi:hypothetical protein
MKSQWLMANFGLGRCIAEITEVYENSIVGTPINQYYKNIQ